jgi:hypothetical protein
LNNNSNLLTNDKCYAKILLTHMKKGSTVLLKTVILLIGTIVLAGMIRLPQTEGRAANLDLISIYKDPFIIYMYIASIPFFVGLYQTFKLLTFIDQNRVFSKNAVFALRKIRNCALLIIGFIVGAAVFIILNHAQDDDPAGFIALCIFVSFASGIVATTAHIFEKLLQKKVTKK